MSLTNTLAAQERNSHRCHVYCRRLL